MRIGSYKSSQEFDVLAQRKRHEEYMNTTDEQRAQKEH